MNRYVVPVLLGAAFGAALGGKRWIPGALTGGILGALRERILYPSPKPPAMAGWPY